MEATILDTFLIPLLYSSLFVRQCQMEATILDTFLIPLLYSVG